MGRQSRIRQLRRGEPAQTAKPKIIHTKKLFDGRETAQEVHARYAWTGARCYVCRDRHVVIQLSYAMPPKDLITREPFIAAEIIERSENDMLPIWHSKFGPMVWYWVEHACPTHRKHAEREAAKLPSYIHVEIDRGVGEDKPLVQVVA